jgi:hypothetical protein
VVIPNVGDAKKAGATRPTVPETTPAAAEPRKSTDMSDLIKQAGATLPGADFVVPEELIRDVQEDYVPEPQHAVPTVDLTAELTSSAETIEEEPVVSRIVSTPPPGLHGAPMVEPVIPEPTDTVMPIEEPVLEPEPEAPLLPPPTHEQLRRARRSVRWEMPPLRKPKMPKLAIPTPPITFKPPKESVDLGISFDRLFKVKVRRVSKVSLLFLLPAFIGFSLFSWYPMIKGFFISLFNYAPIGTSTFVGAANYVRAFHDEMFWRTLMHAGGFCAMALALGFWLPVFLSIMLNEIKWGKGMLKFLFFLPFLMPSVPAAILWKWI